MAPFAVVRDDLARIGVFADLRIGHRADRKVSEVRVRIVDDLMRRIGTADRAADDVAGAELARLASVAQRARAADDEKHLFLRTVAVERTGTLSRRHDVVRVAEIACAHERPDAHAARSEFVSLGEIFELQLVHVDHVLQRSISPKTMSCVPMIATASAIMWPRAISSSAARCGKPGARSLRR